MKERWFIKSFKGDFKRISDKYGISEITARLLVNRGIRTDTEIEEYLNAEKAELSEPSLMYDLDKACGILAESIKENNKIRIIGDYDVDGVCSAYILYDYFKNIGASVSFDIPDRVQDGYGINENIIDKAYSDGVEVIMTCDNGIAAYNQITHAKKLGLTVIVTDHHDIPIGTPLPPADAVTDPKREDCDYPFKGLCGAGVAYQLIRHFAKKYCKKKKFTLKDIEKRYLAFTALATVCDVMELKRENRTIVKKGLNAIRDTENTGLKALLKVAEIEDEEEIKVYYCGFILGPMINASGRLESAKKALELFLTDDMDEALLKAEKLKALNNERKDITEQSIRMAVEAAESEEYKDDKVLVILLSDCHESIAGIVAGRIKERFNKPSLIFTYAERGIKGSGRSIEEYNMFEEISKCSECFSKFGGHPMAAGFTLDGDTEEEQKANFYKLKKKLNENTKLNEEDLKPKVSFDMELPLVYATEELINEMSVLEPFGTGNPAPLFAKRDVYVQDMRILGKNRNVVKLTLTDMKDGKIYNGIIFEDSVSFTDYLNKKEGKKLDIIYRPEINEYNGRRSVQIKIENYR